MVSHGPDFMKKLFAALIVSGCTVAYLTVGDLLELDAPAPLPVAQVPASAPEEEFPPATEADAPEQAASASVADPVVDQLPSVTSRLMPSVARVKPAPVTRHTTASVAQQAEVPKIERPQQPEPVAAPELRLMIRQIQLDGVTAINPAELQQVVQEFIGQELNLEQALAIPARISSYYQSKNMVARATLVGSLERNGVLRVGVIESQVSQSQLDQQLKSVAAAEQPPVLHPLGESAVAKLEVKEGAAVPISPPILYAPVPAKDRLSEEEETELILKQYAKRSRQYELIADNYGHEATGANRMGAGMSWHDVLGRGNTLSLQGLKTRGSDFVQAGYDWATGVDGLKLGARLSEFNYEVVKGLQNALYVSGEAIKQSGFMTYELINSPSEYSSLGLHYDSAKLRNKGANEADSAYYDTTVMGIEFKGFEREMAPGGAVLTYGLRLSQGDVDMMGSPNYAADLAGENTGGRFNKYRLNGTLLQPLGGVSSFFMGLTLQRANKNLPASEKLYLGGPMGVRAYGVGEGMGSDGEMATFELRQRLSAKTTLAEFYDVGHIRSWQNAGMVQPGGTLAGVGMSVSHKFDSDITMKATWARRMGETPELHLMPRGHDGEFERNRFWLSLDARF